jgi:asparagine synthase (glutamine-hydrolysing)
MCGIFYTSTPAISNVVASSRTLSNRGPDASSEQIIDGKFFAFHRLAINDLSSAGMQPFVTEKFVFICNGEIYNSKNLRSMVDAPFMSNSDCEVIPHLIMKYGINTTLSLIEGVFAFVFFDRIENRIISARDAIGVKSLYIGTRDDEVTVSCESPIVIASELKAIHPICATGSVSQFPAGHYYDSSTKSLVRWANLNFNPRQAPAINTYTTSDCVLDTIRKLIIEAVRIRLHTTDRQVGCFLSGGLDSSLIAAIATKLTVGKKIKTFSVGIEGSTDLKAAKKVATWIGSDHHELIVTEEEMLAAIPRTIKRIESYDVTTVRASTPMVLLSDWIKDKFSTTVLFSGEGADELSGSYKYFEKAPSNREFQKESVRLVSDLQYFDVLRCDKSVSGSGLEARTPFFDMKFVNFYMRLNPGLKRVKGTRIEKQLLRDAFRSGDLLPPALLDRRKEAFSDGCSSLSRPWFQVIQDHVEKKLSDYEFKMLSDKFIINKPLTKEGLWFRSIFEKHYPDRGNVVPYIWRPKWCHGMTDPSARLIS